MYRTLYRRLIAKHTQAIGTAIFLGLLLPWTAPAAAQDSNSEASAAADPTSVHKELRALRDRMFAAYESRDMTALLTDVADDVVITWQNGERNIGHKEFLAFYDRMVNGDNPIVKDMSSIFEVEDLSLLYGDDTAVAYGTLEDTFALSNGSEFILNSKWTATVVKQDGDWKVASFHVSSNLFDNPILDVAESWLAKAATGGGLIGLILGLILGRVTKRAA